MKRFLNKTVSVKLIMIVLLAALGISLALLLRLGIYSVPWYDDYGYTKYTKSFQDVYGKGFYNALRGALFQTRETWYCWQGTFSSVFLMAFCPLAFGENFYWIGPWFLIMILTVSSMVFGKTVSKRVFGLKEDASWCLAVAFPILTVWRLFSACEGFYWYNSGIHYVGMHSFMMLFAATLVCLSDRKGVASDIFKTIASVILAFLCSGANYVTALQGILLLAVVAAYAAFSRKRKPFIFIPAAIMYAVGFWYNVSAQGNAVRSSYFTESAMSPVKAVLMSFVNAARFLWEFTGVFTLVFIVAAVPIIWKGLGKPSFKFKFPAVFVALAFCFYATSFTPTLYAIGSSDIGRVLNAAKITYQIMLFLSALYVVGWARAKFENAREDMGFVWLYALCIVALLIPFAVSGNARIRYTPFGAYYYVHTGEAAAYRSGYLANVEEIKSREGDVLVTRNIFKPPYLCAGELSEDPNYEPNRFMAQWYGKNSIAVISDRGGND